MKFEYSIKAYKDIQVLEIDEVYKDCMGNIIDSPINEFAKQIINVKEKAIIDGLIALGWTPPSENIKKQLKKESKFKITGILCKDLANAYFETVEKFCKKSKDLSLDLLRDALDEVLEAYGIRDQIKIKFEDCDEISLVKR